MAAYGGVLADVLLRADGAAREELAPGAGLGAMLLVAGLVLGGRTIGPALWFGGATYVGFLVAHHHGIDPAAPLVAVLLLVCGELSAWSLDERWRMRADAWLFLRRGAAVAVLGLGGLAAATLVVVLGSGPPSHGLLWTIAGALASVAAVVIGVQLARR